jgi:cysteinyl-tRNA synthetase
LKILRRPWRSIFNRLWGQLQAQVHTTSSQGFGNSTQQANTNPSASSLNQPQSGALSSAAQNAVQTTQNQPTTSLANSGQSTSDRENEIANLLNEAETLREAGDFDQADRLCRVY